MLRAAVRFAITVALTLSISGTIQAASALIAGPAAVCTSGVCKVTFMTTGDYYQWTVPYTGSYTLEVWGAGGGGAETYFGAGGPGGYASGVTNLTAGASLYIYVGQKGFQSSTTQAYNGGGFGNVNAGGYGAGYTGGGATHIATSVGLLSTLSTNQNAVLVVAGGGGGGSGSNSAGWAGLAYAGGAGGGTTGGNGTGGTNPGTGGTQSAPGTSPGGEANAAAFGKGSNAVATTYNYIQGGGGGGGWYGGGSGGDGSGAGAGGSGYVKSTLTSPTLISGDQVMPSPTVGTQTGPIGDGAVRITYDLAPSVTSFTSAQSSPTNTTGSISYSLTFSQNVNTVANTDFSNAGTATGCAFSISAASGTSFTLTVSSCSEGTLRPQVNAGSVYGTVTSSAGPTANALAQTTIVLDRTAPTISSVTGPSNNTYTSTNSLTFTVNYSETVTVTGSPQLSLTIGSTTRSATYTSGSNSRALIFSYTIINSTDEVDSNGISLGNTLSLNTGSIVDLASNAQASFTFTAPNLSLVLVAQLPSAPTIDSITANSAQLLVYFTAGANNGSTITNFQYSIDNGSTWTTRSPISVTSPLTINSLVNGSSYQVKIRAVNSIGAGESSQAFIGSPNTATSVTLQLTGGVLVVTKGQSINIIASVSRPGKLTVLVDGKKVPGCINMPATSGSKSCSWRPAIQKAVTISANFTPTDNTYLSSTASLRASVARRTALR